VLDLHVDAAVLLVDLVQDLVEVADDLVLDVVQVVAVRLAVARKVSGWPKRWKLAHAFLWEYSDKRLKLAQLLGQLGVFLTCRP
jgi:hypothetical protein